MKIRFQINKKLLIMFRINLCFFASCDLGKIYEESNKPSKKIDMLQNNVIMLFNLLHKWFWIFGCPNWCRLSL